MSSDARYLTSFPGTKSDLPTVFPETSGYYPIISSDDEQDEFGMPYMPDPQPSLAKRAGRAFRAFKEAVSARFTKPNVSGSVMVVPKAETPHATFEEFLSAKAQKGFSAKDKLAIRGIEFITAEGLGNKVKAFFALGGIGYFFAEKVTDSNREALITEARFYRECCKVQDFYRAFNKKPDAANFKGLQTAYETVLAMGESAAQHDKINLILNERFAKGSSVGEAILSHEAKTSLTSLGGFNAESIVETITGVEFLRDIHAKSAMGYRGRALTDKEESVVNTADRRLIDQDEINAILADKSTRSIFLSYARVFNQLRDSEEAYTLCTDVVEALSESTVSEGQVDRKVAGYNDLLLDLIKNPEKTVSLSALPQVARDALEEMTDIYREHQENLAAQPKLMVAQKAALSAQAKADAALKKEEAKTRSCTLAELETVLGEEPDEELPAFEDYTVAVTAKAQMTKDLEAQNLAIQARKEELEGALVELTRVEAQLANHIAIEQQTIDENAQTLIKSGQQVTELGKRRFKKQQGITGSRAVPVVTTAFSLISAAEEKLDELEPQHEDVVTKITAARAELALLNKDSVAHEAIRIRDGLAKQLAIVNAKRFNLTHAEITAIYRDPSSTDTTLDVFQAIADKVDALRETKEERDDEITALADKLEETGDQIAASTKALRKFGFEVSDQGVVGALNFAGFDEAFKRGIEATIAAQGPLSAKIVVALQAAASTPLQMHQAMLFNSKTHKKVDIVTTALAVDSNTMIVRSNTLIARKKQAEALDYEVIADAVPVALPTSNGNGVLPPPPPLIVPVALPTSNGNGVLPPPALPAREHDFSALESVNANE